MNVVIVGGGPAGLYLALLLRKADPTHRITVAERNAADDTFGWGVVFSDQTLENFRRADAESHDEIAAAFAHWDDIDIHVRDRVITSGGHGFSGIARTRLIEILQRRAVALGVDLRFRCEIASPADVARLGVGEPDLLVAADGANSAMRRAYARQFKPDLDVRSARFIWLGTTKLFDAFTFIFVENECGVFQVHAYRFDETRSAFIVECDERSWRAAGFETMDADATVARCEELFARWLDGHALMHNAAHQREQPWLRFVRVGNERWFHERVVLLGDAAHTAHFSIGSGTKLAMEDAIALARILGEGSGEGLADMLARYQAERQTEALRLQNAARNSMEWFENVRRYIRLEPEQFAYSLLTRSQRVSHENLRLRDRDYLTGVERWLAGRAGGAELEQVPPPMFTPWRLRGMSLGNRIVVAPMDMYSATDGVPNDFHVVHYGARALGGAGLVVTEMTCVTPDGRITKGCTGMYDAAHVAAWQRIVHFVHGWTGAKICLQLGHAGRKGATRLPWEGGELAADPDESWSVIAPSAVAYAPGLRIPREMSRGDMDDVRDAHVRATRMAIDAGFDMVELHCAHGYLLSSFITPLGNQRDDEYGGSLENRLRFPIEVFSAMRARWPEDRPMSVRISATDWVEGGLSPEESVRVARAFGEAGVDVVHVSTGQTSIHAKPVYGRLYQTPYSDRIRNESGVPAIAVGNIVEPDQVNAIIAAGRADLCALARPHLTDPHWTLRAAASLRWEGQEWPVQYTAGRRQLERQLEREAELRGSSTI